jgi:polyhydroxyalkanoate synthase
MGREGPSLDCALQAWRARLTGGISPIAYALAYMDWFTHLAEMPERQAELGAKALTEAVRTSATGGLRDPESGPGPDDPRFTGAEWQRWPFSVVSEAFLKVEEWWQDATTGVPGVSSHHERMVSFAGRNALDMLSPSNFVATNPDVLKATFDQRGGNLLRGGRFLLEDWERLVSRQEPVGAEAFAPGESVAITPGKVVYRNRLIELIQYAPVTDTVHAAPILIVPAWIMKYYILDLSPHNSLVSYLVERGHTVFMISWRNPTAEDRDLGLEDYRELGVMSALEAATAIVPDTRIHGVGYCLGGTMLALSAAAMAREGDERLRSVTLLAAETDFTEPGEIGLFLDESQAEDIENIMWDQGYLDAQQMAGAFQLLRPYELIWSRIVGEYLLGERELPNDLMAWNADGTRLPYRMHSEYLRSMFLRNDLFEGRYLAGGRPVALGDLRVPLFVVGTVRDHVAPWRSVYKLNLVTETELTFLLTSGGHNAGIVSEPGHPHRSFQCATRRVGARYVDPDRWAAETPTEEGSWWPRWEEWLARRSGKRGAPPGMGAPSRGYAPLCRAPGTYVLER